MKYLVTESQFEMLINEETKLGHWKLWYSGIQGGRETFNEKRNEELQNISEKIKEFIYPLTSTITQNMSDSFINDAIKGKLSQSTIDIFNKNISSYLSKLSNDPKINEMISKIPPYQKKMAKSVGVSKIKNMIDKGFKLIGDGFFKQGFYEGLKKSSEPNSSLVKNYGKVAIELGNQISNNQPLKDYTYKFVMSKL